MNSYIPLIALIACAQAPLEQVQDAQNTSQEEQEDYITERFDFGTVDGEEGWFALNDDVMGGVSVGEVSLTQDTLIFEGAVSTDNNGGFVSLRSPTDSYDLSDFSEVVISYRAEGHDFSMVLANHSAWYRPKFEHRVISPSSEWTTTTVSLSDFKQYEMTGYGDVETGVELSEQHLSNIIRMEFINSEFQGGDFRLELDYVEFRGFEPQDDDF